MRPDPERRQPEPEQREEDEQVQKADWNPINVFSHPKGNAKTGTMMSVTRSRRRHATTRHRIAKSSTATSEVQTRVHDLLKPRDPTGHSPAAGRAQAAG